MVRSAARAQPLPEHKQKLSTERLREGALDTLLNGFSILGEVIDDFKKSDRFFKYKALVIGLWLTLAALAFAHLLSSEAPNELDALLVVSGDSAAPIYMVKNQSADTWEDVELIVNGTYSTTLARIAGGGGNSVISQRGLFDEQGKPAPAHLRIIDITVKVRAPRAEVVLLKAGVPLD